MDRERLKGNLDLLLLSVLSSGPAHGYAIISALRDRSGGTFDLPEGTIYPALHRLEDAGLLASTWAQAEGRRRRVYGLTGRGAAALAAQQTEWRRFAGGVHAVLGWAAQAVLRPPARLRPSRGGRHERGGRQTGAAPDLIARYLAELGAGLWVPADEAELILAEAEDHLRETAAVGLEVGMTELEAQQAAISSFGPVRAVIWAHRRRAVTAGDAAVAAWKLTGLLAATVGAGGLAAVFLLHSPLVWATGVRAVQDGPGVCQCSISVAPITGPAAMALPFAAMATGGLALLATRRLASPAGPARNLGPGSAVPGGNGELLPAGIGAAVRARRERRGGGHPNGGQLDHPDLIGLHHHDRSPRTGCHRRRMPGAGRRHGLQTLRRARSGPRSGAPAPPAGIRCPGRYRRASSCWYRRCCSRST